MSNSLILKIDPITGKLSEQSSSDAAMFQNLSSSPASPASGKSLIYPDSSGNWYTKDASGNEVLINPKYYGDATPQNYTETIVVSGGTTTPSSLIGALGAYQRHGNFIFVNISAYWSSPGSANTTVKLPIPAALPQPVAFVLGAGTGHHVYAASGYFDSGTNGAVPACRCSLNRQTSGSGWEFLVQGNAQNINWVAVQGMYLTS